MTTTTTVDLTRVEKEFRTKVPCGTRKHRLKTYQRAFYGSEAVKWLVDNGHANDRGSAVRVGEALRDRGIFWFVETLERDHPFEDSLACYEMCYPPDTKVIERKVGEKLPRHETLLKEYLDTTGAQLAMEAALEKLMSMTQLPESPYPTVLAGLRAGEQRVALFQEDPRDLLVRLFVEVSPPDPRDAVPLTRPASTSHVWGLKEILRVLDGDELELTETMLDELVKRQTLPTRDDNEAKVVVALVGAGVFAGRMSPYVTDVLHLRQEYIAAGTSADAALVAFGDYVSEQLTKLASDRNGVFLLTGFVMYNPNSPQPVRLSPQDIIGFAAGAVGKQAWPTVAASGSLFAEGIFRLQEPGTHDLDRAQLRVGTIEYSYHFVETDYSCTRHYGSLPFRSVFDGIFFNKSDALVYIEACSFNPRKSKSRMKPAAGDAVRIFDRSRIDFIELQLESVAKARYAGNDFAMFTAALPVVLLDERDELVPVLYGMLRSPAARLRQTMQSNTLIRRALADRANVPVLDDMIDAEFQRYATDLLFCINSNVSSEFVPLRGFLLAEFGAICGGKRELLRTDDVVERLTRLNNYVRPLLVSIAADVAANSKAFEEFVEEVVASLSGRLINPAPVTTALLTELKRVWEASKERPAMVVDVPLAASKMSRADRVLPYISSEAVKAQYVVDTHLDAALHDAWRSLLASGSLPRNCLIPISGHVVGSAYRFGTMRDTRAALRAMCVSEVAVEDALRYVYATTPAPPVYGPYAAAQIANGSAMNDLFAELNDIPNGNAVWEADTHKVTLFTAIAGTTLLYGGANEMLRDIEIIETYLITGDNVATMVNLFRTNVMAHINALLLGQRHLVLGLQLGSTFWPVSRLAARSSSFETAFREAAVNCHSIFVKMYYLIKRTYYPLTKHYRLLQIGSKSKPKSYSPPAIIPRHFMVLSSPANAALASSASGFAGDPASDANRKECLKELRDAIRQALRVADYERAYGLYHMRCSLKQELDNAVLVARMMRSPAAVLAALADQVATVVDILGHFADYEKFLSMTPLKATLLEVRHRMEQYLAGPEHVHMVGASTFITRSMLDALVEVTRDTIMSPTSIPVLTEVADYLRLASRAAAGALHELLGLAPLFADLAA